MLVINSKILKLSSKLNDHRFWTALIFFKGDIFYASGYVTQKTHGKFPEVWKIALMVSTET